MRVSIFRRGGYGHGVISGDGGEVFGKVILGRDPIEDFEATTKKYADESTTNVHAGSFSEGILDKEVIPAFEGGDVLKEENSLTLKLSHTGVASGKYTKVTVDEKGRVYSGGSLVEGDLPRYPWGKLEDTPTDLAGYGILDAVSVNGGNLSGRVTIPTLGYDDDSLVNKSYIDTYLNAANNVIRPGVIMLKAVENTPDGWFRCNGAYLSKDLYPELYSVIGDKYNPIAVPGAGKPWKQQYGINNNDIRLGSWRNEPNLPVATGWSQTIVVANKVHILGGEGQSHVITTSIDGNGELGNWVYGANLPANFGQGQAIVLNNFVYLMAGGNRNVYRAAVTPNGDLGSFELLPNLLPANLHSSQAVVTKSRIYLLGGTANVCYYTDIGEDGDLGAWYNAGGLPVHISESQAVVTKNRVYLCGGYTGSAASISARIDENGHLVEWRREVDLPGARRSAQAIVTSTEVVLLGGYDNVVTCIGARILEDGTLGPWEARPNLSRGHGMSQAIVTSSRLYLIGSYRATTVTSAPLLGGRNDYTEYYDGSFEAVGDTEFAIPFKQGIGGANYFIKQ